MTEETKLIWAAAYAIAFDNIRTHQNYVSSTEVATRASADATDAVKALIESVEQGVNTDEYARNMTGYSIACCSICYKEINYCLASPTIVYANCPDCRKK